MVNYGFCFPDNRYNSFEVHLRPGSLDPKTSLMLEESEQERLNQPN